MVVKVLLLLMMPLWMAADIIFAATIIIPVVAMLEGMKEYPLSLYVMRYVTK